MWEWLRNPQHPFRKRQIVMLMVGITVSLTALTTPCIVVVTYLSGGGSNGRRN